MTIEQVLLLLACIVIIILLVLIFFMYVRIRQLVHDLEVLQSRLSISDSELETLIYNVEQMIKKIKI
jgi:cell division protein FtsL